MKDKKKTNVIYQFITDIIMKKLQKQKKQKDLKHLLKHKNIKQRNILDIHMDLILLLIMIMFALHKKPTIFTFYL